MTAHDVQGVLRTLELLKANGFAVTWIDAEGCVRFEAPAPPPDDVIARLDEHDQVIAMLYRPDSSGWSGLDYRRTYAEHLDARLLQGCDPAEAQAAAFRDIVGVWFDRDFAEAARFASPAWCAHCRAPKDVDNVLLPIGWGQRHVFVHDHCWEVWRAARRDKAMKTLAAYGITV
jgi:hypothetical protein